MSDRNVKKAETKQKIMQAAYNQFVEKGILATRMQDVADAAQVSHGSVFVHFKSQEALVSAVIEEYGWKACSRTHQLASRQQSIKGVLEAHLQVIAEFEDFYYRLISEFAQLPQDCREQFIMIQSAVSLHLSETAESGMKNGFIRPMPLYLLFNTWMGLVHYYLLNRDLFAPDDSLIKCRGNELLEHFIKLVQKED